MSFTIGRGETVGLVGESGCGKSTLVRLINRLLDPTSGSIDLAGTDLAAFKANAFAANPNRARIQMVFQDAGDSLNPRYTAADAIADPVRRLKKMSGADLRRRVEALADMTGLFAELALYWTRFSDMEPYIDRLTALLRDLDVDLIAPTHGLPISDVAVTAPRVLDGLRKTHV